MQCTCMALTFLCLSSKPESSLIFYQPEVIDNILRHGNDLYKRHSAEFFSDKLTFSVADGLHRCFEQSPYCFMTIGKGGSSGYTTAVVKVSVQRYFPFDSHARDAKGLRSASGKAVIIQASSVLCFAEYVNDLSKSIFAETLIPFELVVVSVSCEYDEAEDATTAGDLPTYLSSDKLAAASAGKQYPHKRQRVGARSDNGSETLTRHTDNDFSVFVPVNNTGRRLVRCSVCFEHQEVLLCPVFIIAVHLGNKVIVYPLSPLTS